MAVDPVSSPEAIGPHSRGMVSMPVFAMRKTGVLRVSRAPEFADPAEAR